MNSITVSWKIITFLFIFNLGVLYIMRYLCLEITNIVRLSNGLRWVCWTSKSGLSSTTKCDKIIFLAVLNVVAPRAGAKHELIFNQPASEASLWSRSSCLAAALGVTIQSNHCSELRPTLLFCLSRTWMFNKPTSAPTGLATTRLSCKYC